MQFLIKGLNDSDNGQYDEQSRYILAIEDNFLIIKYTNKNHTELYRKSLIGWHNIRFNDGKYLIDSDVYINIESDILIQDDNKYELKHFGISFIPMQVHNLNKFFDYLNALNKNSLNNEQLKIAEQLRILELEAKQKEEERLKIEVERLRVIEAKRLMQELEAKRKEKERLKAIEAENFRIEQLEKQNFINIVNKIKEDRKLEKLFLNYFNKYVKQTLLHPECYISLLNYLLKENHMYHRVKMDFPKLYSMTIDYSINSQNYKLNEIDKMIGYMEKSYSNGDKESAKLLTWIVVCDVAITYYSNCFYILYGKQIDNIENLNLVESISKYIHSDILDDSQEIRNMFVYFLMSIKKFEEIDLDKGYIFCRNVFIDIYEKLRSENEYNSFISSLLSEEQSENKIYTIDDVDLMTGSEFEIFVGNLFRKMGYKAIVTKASGDQGIDVVAEKNGTRLGVQAKCYSNIVSNSAIQEVVAGISFYKCDKAIVITNNYFTNSAIELAKANEVILWNREMLKQKIQDLFS